MENAFRRAAEAVGNGSALIPAPGSGIGVDSGLPDFRGDEGFRDAYPPLCRLRLDFYAMARPGRFEGDSLYREHATEISSPLRTA